MYRRIFSLMAVGILVPAVLAGCGPKAEPTETAAPPIGMVAEIPQETPTSIPAPTPSPTPTPMSTPAPTLTPTPAPAPAPTPEPSPATPLTILSIGGGEVWVMSAGEETWHRATAETTLQPGDTIKALNDKAVITFFEGSTIELEANARIGVDEIGISPAGSTTIRLSQQLGKTISRVKKLVDADSVYEIETPAAIAAVRGSTMVVTVDDTGKTVVANEGGDIRVIVDGKEYIIHEGMQRTIIPGQEPGPETPIHSSGGGGGSSGETVLRARMEVTMQAAPQEVRVGENVTYTYTLVNIGDLPFQNITVISDIAGSATYQSGDLNNNSILNPGETWVFLSAYTVKATDPSPLVATAIISATTFTAVTIVDTEITTTPILSSPGIALDKNADRAMAHVGDSITYTYTVTNAGNVALGNITVTDDLIEAIAITGGDVNENGLLDVTETWEFTADYPVGAPAPETLVNTANVTGTYDAEIIVKATDNSSVAILRPGIALDKTAAPGTVFVGDNITYTYIVTNTGNTLLENISVMDNIVGPITVVTGNGNGDSLLDIGETWTFTANYTTSFEDAGLLENTANASGMDALEFRVNALDSAAVTVLTGGITLEKSANATMVHVGDNITYTYTVTALGNYALFNVSIIDDRLGVITRFTGDTDEDNDLDTDETWVFTANYTANIEDPDLLVNTAIASGMDNWERDVIATDSSSVSILKPGITLEKTAEPSEDVDVGDIVTYTFTVSNDGNTPLSNIQLADDRIEVITLIYSGNGDNILDVDETWEFTAIYTVTRYDTCPLENTAVVSGWDILLRIVTAEDTAIVHLAD